jgi:hypothetical protein
VGVVVLQVLLDSGLHLDVHLIADNYATHKHAKVQACRSGISGSTCTSPRLQHRGSTKPEDRIRRGVFKSVAELLRGGLRGGVATIRVGFFLFRHNTSAIAQ